MKNKIETICAGYELVYVTLNTALFNSVACLSELVIIIVHLYIISRNLLDIIV